MAFANYTTSSFALSHFRFNALWLHALNYANPLFSAGLSFLFTPYRFTPTFSGSQLGENKGWMLTE
jgi:hypothetical protein